MVGLDNPLHIALVLIVVLMVFGAKRLPEMGKGIGEGMRSFKHGISGESHEPHAQVSLTPVDEPTAAPQPPAAEREPGAPTA